MREDMAKVTRPRCLDAIIREGRILPPELLPTRIGLHRRAQERGGYKRLNENLAPLRRYLEAQVGRPWNAVYAEIAANLSATSTVQQHVRDHLKDFVNLHRTRTRSTLPLDGAPWFEPLYVDRHGALRRTDKLREPGVKTRRSRAGSPTDPPIRLSSYMELRKLRGIWYEVRLRALPIPEYRLVARRIDQPAGPCFPGSRTRKADVRVRQLVTPAVCDAVTGEAVLAGPETDDSESWRRYKESRPERLYAVARRQFSRRDLRRHGLINDPPVA